MTEKALMCIQTMKFVYSSIADAWTSKLTKLRKKFAHIMDEEPVFIQLIAECFLSLNLLLPGYKWYSY